MVQTLVQNALSRRFDREVSEGEIVTVQPDRVMSHDNTAFIVKKFLKTGMSEVWDPNRVVVIFDHCVPADNPAHSQNHQEARDFVKEQGITQFFDAGYGVCHQVMVESGLVLPGELVLGADSHSTLYGAVNAVGIPINRTEMAGIWATGKIWLRVPATIRIELDGAFGRGVYAKDLMLHLLAVLRADGAAYRALEFGGPAVSRLGMSERMTLSNMAVEIGAKCGVFPFDDTTSAYLNGRTTRGYQPVAADEGAKYERTLRVSLSELEPQIACPHTVDNVKPLSAVAGRPVHQAYLGSCTNGRLDDLRIAADILDGRRVKSGLRLVVYPASTEVQKAAIAEGIYAKLEAAGAQLMGASCGPCFGAVGATLGPGEVCISSSNRNFSGRMGSQDSFVYLASPAVVAASCIKGVVTDPREYL